MKTKVINFVAAPSSGKSLMEEMCGWKLLWM